jgi:hypothetical protein
LSSYSASPLDEEKLVEMVELEMAIELEDCSGGIWEGAELLAGAIAELESGAGEEELSGSPALESELESALDSSLASALESALELALDAPGTGVSCVLSCELETPSSVVDEDDSSSPISGAIVSNAAELSSAHP